MKTYTKKTGKVKLPADIVVPDGTRGVVVFAHGSGSSRLSVRNRLVASRLNDCKFATVLFDLLTEEEAENRNNVFDIPLLGLRMTDTLRSISGEDNLRGLPIGLFGASTGAAAALWTAAELPVAVRAIVSRGGRPDLALDVLDRVKAPTLLIIGGEDRTVIGLNRLAYTSLTCKKHLEIVPGATHLFEEHGAMEHVIQLAAGWFTQYLLHKEEIR